MSKRHISDNEYPEDLRKEEERTFEEDDSSEQPPPDIVAFNELRSCADLVRMVKTSQLIIKPDFQRDIVWSPAARTRFIDSLTKQLPIPSMCISLDYKSDKRLVIDGLQRMHSIITFLTDDSWKLSRLNDIDQDLSGKRVSYIKENYRPAYDRVQNLTLPITVLRCDYSKPSHMEYLFTIFHRLNTGGNKLTNQEIRNCIYSGPLNDLLTQSVKNQKFRDLFGLDDEKAYRYQYEEFVLRVFAFAEGYAKYDGNLSRYLNEYMERHRNLTDEHEIDKKRSLFERTVAVIHDKITEGAALPKVSKATTESLFVGVALNIENLEET
jgi:uncharacterized protein with ParB-like and HNH nuclease domain